MIRRLVTRYWLLLPLLIIVVVLLDRVEQPDVIETEETLDMRQTQSDYYLSDFRTRRYDADGNIEYIINGKTLAHYPDDDRSVITLPRVELRGDEVQWLVESERGRFDPAPELFTLQGNVTVKRVLQSASTDTIIMTTESLRIANEANLVETDDLVVITAPTWSLQANGFRTAIDNGQLSLLSDVVGRYEMPPAEQETQ